MYMSIVYSVSPTAKAAAARRGSVTRRGARRGDGTVVAWQGRRIKGDARDRGNRRTGCRRREDRPGGRGRPHRAVCGIGRHRWSDAEFRTDPGVLACGSAAWRAGAGAPAFRLVRVRQDGTDGAVGRRALRHPGRRERRGGRRAERGQHHRRALCRRPDRMRPGRGPPLQPRRACDLPPCVRHGARPVRRAGRADRTGVYACAHLGRGADGARGP